MICICTAHSCSGFTLFFFLFIYSTQEGLLSCCLYANVCAWNSRDANLLMKYTCLKTNHHEDNMPRMNKWVYTKHNTHAKNMHLCKIKQSHISTMPSGRLAGISVRPLRRQSTMLLLQLQLGGHTATWGTQVLDSVCAGPADRNIQIERDTLTFFLSLFFASLQLKTRR